MAVALSLVSTLAGCGSSGAADSTSSGSNASDASSAADGATNDAASMSPTGAAGASAPTTPGGGPGAGLTPVPSTNATAPGKYVTATTTAGSGPCVGVTLASLIEKIHATTPALADITTVYNPATVGGDGSFIYPYARADGGFDIVFKVGLGDCLAGCIDNAYQYFATDATCTPLDVGHYHATWGTQNCLTVDGAPMWNHPPPPDPLTVCGQDNTPRDLRGTYLLHAAGQRTPCSATASKAASIDTTVTLLVEQPGKDLAAGFVTFSGTGHALVDGVRLPARFQRSRFDASSQSSNLPNTCPREQSVTSRYDFENYQPGGIEVTESGNDACAVCKGSMSLTLTSTTVTQAP